MKFGRLYGVVGGYFRRRRLRWVASEFQGCESVIDLGGTPESWPAATFSNLTLVNVVANSRPLPPGASYLQAAAMCRWTGRLISPIPTR